MQIYSFQPKEPDVHTRLDVYLTHKIPDAPSRTFIRQLIDNGQVTVNEKVVKAHHKVGLGEKIEVRFEPVSKDRTLKAENIPLDIFYEDEFLLIVQKPVGMLVHPANSANMSGTLANALLHYCDKLSNINTDVRPGIVHRLDKETSGLLVVAKDNRTHARLARQFEKHRVKKQYVALAEGSVEFDEGVIDASIDRHPRQHDFKKVSFNDSAKEAMTFYKVIARGNNATLIHLFPKTGRTHQLRVHMAHLHHSILGDDKYGKAGSFPRLALHAKSIGFSHPATDRYVEFSSRTPEEFTTYCSSSS